MSRIGLTLVAIFMSFDASAEWKDVLWARHTIDASSQGADGARLADINGDGLMDVVTPWEEGGAIRIAFHPGVDKVTEPWPSVEVGRVGKPEDAFAMDVDGDGRLDVVSSCEGNTRAMYVHWAPDDPTDAGGWVTENIPASKGLQRFMFSVAVDVNGDGREDIVSGGKNEGAQLGWFEAPENPRKLEDWTWHKMVDVGWVMSIRVFERKDETPSILISDRKGARRGVFFVYPTDDILDTWERRLSAGVDREVMFLDWVGDTIAWATRDGGVTVFSKDGLEEIPMPEGAGTGKAVAIGDLDGDGDEDLVVDCEASDAKFGLFGFEWDENSEEWKFHDIAGPTGTKFDRIELIDLDGDGDLDVLTCEEKENLGVIWYENPTTSAKS
ncbi:MAG: VCBS repeat-containing protein [Candidatus Hydrogenedentota bacterium]